MTLTAQQKIQDLFNDGTFTLEDIPALFGALEMFQFFKGTTVRSIEEMMADARLISASDELRCEDQANPAVYRCPYCGKSHYVKDGRDHKGQQRYKCKECGKSFKPRSMSIFTNAKLSIAEVYKLIGHFLDGISVRKTAALTGLNPTTVFFWRHKLDDLLLYMMGSQKLSGTIEADETYFEISYKGNHSKDGFHIPRTATKVNPDGTTETVQRIYHRGAKGQKSTDNRKGIKSKRGLSSDLLGIPCAVDRNGRSVGYPASRGNCSKTAIINALDGHLDSYSTIYTDGSGDYEALADLNRLEWKQLKPNQKVDETGKGIQMINNYHSRLKKKINDDFRGVSSKWLPNYIAWFNFSQFHKAGKGHKIRHLLSWVMTCQYTGKRREMPRRDPVPITAGFSSKLRAA